MASAETRTGTGCSSVPRFEWLAGGPGERRGASPTVSEAAVNTGARPWGHTLDLPLFCCILTVFNIGRVSLNKQSTFV